MRFPTCRWLLLSAVLLCALGQLYAQQNSEITGIVLDPSGDAIPGAPVSDQIGFPAWFRFLPAAEGKQLVSNKELPESPKILVAQAFFLLHSIFQRRPSIPFASNQNCFCVKPMPKRARFWS